MTMTYGISLMFAAVYLLVLAAAVCQPYFSARNILFGISIPKTAIENPAVGRLRRSFQAQVLIIGLVVGIVLAVLIIWKSGGTATEESFSVWLTTVPLGGTLAMLGIAGAIFVSFHQKARQLKETEGWQDEESRAVVDLHIRRERMIYPLYAFVPHLLVILICAGAAWLLYDRIPGTIIAHYNAQGIPDRLEAKSFGSVFQLNLFQLSLLIVFIFCNYSIQMARLKLDPTNPEGSRQQQIRYRSGISLMMLVLGLGTLIFMGLVQAFILYGGSRIDGILLGVIGIAPLLMSAGGVLAMLRLGKNRIEVSRPGEDRKWKAGVIYWDRSDASLFVEKRSGMGFTLNLANPISWVILGGILGVVLLPAFLNL